MTAIPTRLTLAAAKRWLASATGARSRNYGCGSRATGCASRAVKWSLRHERRGKDYGTTKAQLYLATGLIVRSKSHAARTACGIWHLGGRFIHWQRRSRKRARIAFEFRLPNALSLSAKPSARRSEHLREHAGSAGSANPGAAAQSAQRAVYFARRSGAGTSRRGPAPSATAQRHGHGATAQRHGHGAAGRRPPASHAECCG